MKGIKGLERPAAAEIGAALGDWLQGLRGRLGRMAALLGRGSLAALAWGGAAFLLAGLRLPGGPAPAAACLSLCPGAGAEARAEDSRGGDLGFGICLGAALLGACGGYRLIWGWESAMEPLALSLSCFAGALIFRRTPVPRPALSAGLCAAVGGLFLLDSGLGLLPLLRLVLGTGLAALTPWFWERRRSLPAAVLPKSGSAEAALPLSPQKGAEKALLTMHGVLAREDPILQPVQLAEVYDFAAEQVCRCCVRHGQCWESQAEDTYRDLCAAGEAMLQRGAALREDLPERFTARCCHTAGFLTAVNQVLEAQLARRREGKRQAEARRVAAGQYLALERLLAALTRPLPRAERRFAPELAVGSACRTGETVSGDRGASFRDRFGRFYVLLCDGMGTGAPARGESDRAARLLTAFLETGMEADTALELMNGFFVLRRDAAFATLDLLRLDLSSGQGILYKWGAAPSYLRRGTAVEKIGTVTPPPGLEASSRVPGQYELSLGEGETLVMVSDGAFGEETARLLEAFTGGTVRDLASCLITMGETDAEDDRTAVVVRLQRTSDR